MEPTAKHDIKNLQHEIKDFEYRLTIKIGVMLILFVVAVVLLQKIL